MAEHTRLIHSLDDTIRVVLARIEFYVSHPNGPNAVWAAGLAEVVKTLMQARRLACVPDAPGEVEAVRP